jgi:FMN-dependent NADH-azoreductase
LPKLFHLRCSPRAGSASSAGADAFVARFRAARPTWDIDVMDLWRERMPEFDGAALEAKYARLARRAFNPSERDAFAEIERIALRFSLADRVLISTPMWNLSIPYKLKHWIDLIVQPGLSFRFDPAEGYRGLFKDRPTIVIIASGADFVTGMDRGRVDTATPYLRDFLRFIGVTSVRFVAIGPTVGPPEAVKAARATGERRLAELAAAF